VRTVRSGPVIGLMVTLALLAALASTVGLSAPGWIAGIACGLATNAALARGLARSAASAMGPADRVTLTRATLVGAVTALTADSFSVPVPVATLVTITTVALLLDGVDGWVARRTESASALGARFDMEVDAFLILVLSVYVARSAGAWVLAIGAARYAFVAASWTLPWMRSTLPPRPWRKVVAAVQGIVLAFAAADLVGLVWSDIAVAGALALLTESFGRDVWWLRGRRTSVVSDDGSRHVLSSRLV
jgi:phosphatidylglycerophosphate synthase